MKIKSINNTGHFAKSNQTTSFGAKVYIDKYVIPYIGLQMSHIAQEEGRKAALQWHKKTVENLQDTFGKLSDVLEEDTPIIFGISVEAGETVFEKNRKYEGDKDGFFVLNANPYVFSAPESILDDIGKAGTPFEFKIGPDNKYVNEIYDFYNNVSEDVAKYFNQKY